MALFSGRTDAHGLGIGRIVKTPPTPALYKAHLAGEDSGLGIFPLRDDGTVSFAVIDIDEPNFELASLLQRFLPGQTWIERSRSGNAHLWAFFAEPIEGWIPRGLMKMALESCGYSNVEVFPKQDRLMEGMVGNYINLPWHGDDRPMLDMTAGGDNGVPYLPGRARWVEDAYESRIDPEEWRVRALKLGIKPPEQRTEVMEQGELGFLHDCAKHILAHKHDNPIQDGHRNVVYFNVAKMLLNWKDLGDDEARMLLHELNDAADPPSSEREVDRIFNNARTGGFTGTGCDDPLMQPYVLPTCPIAKGR